MIKQGSIKQVEETLKQKENIIGILKGNIEDNKKFTENNQNHKTNETEFHNSTQQEHDFVIKKTNFIAYFYGWDSTASRLELLRGGSLLFTTKFPEIPGTHFINLGRMKG